MALEGLHHITAITADAPRNVDFYTRLLGLRMVKKTVNFDQPDVYHLYYGDDVGTPGSILTFFEFPGAAAGRHGDGMAYRIEWRVAASAALDFWSARLGDDGVVTDRVEGELRFADPEGLEHALVVADVPDAPLAARHDEVPGAHALLGFDGVRAYASAPQDSAGLLETLGFTADGELAGAERRAQYAYDPAPQTPGRQGAGSIHHVAWSAADDAELEAFRAKAAEAGVHPTALIDRQYFHSVYFREPNGVLFELASRDVGFDVDEPVATLGHELKLPAQHEHLRARLAEKLTPLPATR